jgi:GPH family glycoside/pentoside/hexuronide:cation symporter
VTATVSSAAPTSRLGLPQIFAFASPGVVLGSYAVAFSVFLPQYFASHIGISTATVGLMLFVVRFIDIWFDPLIGVAMDRTRTPIGRYRFWMLIGAPVFSLAAFMIYMAPQGISVVYAIFWLLVFYIGTSLMSLSHTSWAAVLAPTYNLRSQLFGWMSAIGVVGAAVVLLMPRILGIPRSTDPHLLHTMGWFMIIAAPVGAVIISLTTRERMIAGSHHDLHLREYWELFKRPEVLRILAADLCLALGPGWMAALYFYFFKESRQFTAIQASELLGVYTLAGLLGAVALGRLAVIFGKHRTLMGASTGYSLGLALLFIMPKGNVWIDGPFMFIMGFLATGFTLLIRAMMADVGDQIRLETGRNQMGLLYALIVGTQKLAGAFSIAFTFTMLPIVGYQTKEGIPNAPAAIHGLELVYLVGPIFFVMLGGACFFGYKLNALVHADIRRQLEDRDGMIPEAGVIEAITSDAAASSSAIEPPTPDVAPEPKPS